MEQYEELEISVITFDSKDIITGKIGRAHV